MLYDRSYMKRQHFVSGRTAVETLIFSYLVSFILFFILGLIFTDLDLLLRKYFYFSVSSVSNLLLWTPITYTFFHDGLGHIFLNLLLLFFLGRGVESLIGKYNFYYLFFIGSVLGSIFWSFFHFSPVEYILPNGTTIYQPETLMGASAGVMAILSFYCLKKPDNPITLLIFFVLPCSIKPRWILIGTLLYDIHGLLSYEISGVGNIAHSAHLGGCAAGAFVFLYFRSGKEFPRFVFKFSSSKVSTIFQNQGTSRPKNEIDKSNYKINLSSSTDLQNEVDRILDKINEAGFGSLTKEEKLTLEKAKGLLRN